MVILQIHHRTHYRFRRPVTLLSHRIMATPRSGHELRLLDHRIDAGGGARIDWSDDVFANRIATIIFEGATDDLAIDVDTRVELVAPAFPVFVIAVDAHHYPFAYAPDDRLELGALLHPRDHADGAKVLAWARAFVASPRTDTLALLKDINAGVLNDVTYRTREEEGTQSPFETLALRSGSCRDIAALFIDAVRHLGFGARAVSGYLHDPDLAADDAGSTHAWAEVFLPGAGWIAFDPTHRRVGDASLIPVAVGRCNSRIPPVSGGYLGSRDDALGMEVQVVVREA